MYMILNPNKSEYTVNVFKEADGCFYFNVVHRNGKIICSSEAYTRRSRALAAAQKMTLNVANATFNILKTQ